MAQGDLVAKALRDATALLYATNKIDEANALNTEYDRLRAASEALARLCDEYAELQARACSYGTREGDGRTCDCKYAHGRPSTEVTGCPEYRAILQRLRAITGTDAGHETSGGDRG